MTAAPEVAVRVKARIALGVAPGEPPVLPGQEVDLSPDEAARLIAAGFAEAVEPAKPEKRKGKADE